MKADTETQAVGSRGLPSDWHPFVAARAWPSDRIREQFEQWEPKHVADLVGGPGVVTGAYFHAVTTGIPEAFVGSGTIMAYYTARDVPGLFAFLQSHEFADAVAEGEQWFGGFNPIDFEDIIGNIYTVESVSRIDGSSDAEIPVYTFWQRFEVSEEGRAEFDAWLAGHARVLAGAEGIVRTRTFSAVREGCPLPYYYSRGNRLIAADANSLDALLSPRVREAVIESLRWDVSLEYVKRDIYHYRYHYDSGHGGAY